MLATPEVNVLIISYVVLAMSNTTSALLGAPSFIPLTDGVVSVYLHSVSY